MRQQEDVSENAFRNSQIILRQFHDCPKLHILEDATATCVQWSKMYFLIGKSTDIRISDAAVKVVVPSPSC